MIAIEEKRALLSDESKGAELVNIYLKAYFGHHALMLDMTKSSDADKSTRFRIMRGNEVAYNLSQGECSLIAFCYFVAKLQDIDTFNKELIVWIDDPVSSLDDKHIFFIYSLILEEIVNKDRAKQLFISTHSLELLKYLKRLNSDKLKNKSYWLIHRQLDHSTLMRMPKHMKEYVTEFSFLFSQVYKCSLIQSNGQDEYEYLYGLGNNMRKFLEIYVYFRYPHIEERTDHSFENLLKKMMGGGYRYTLVSRVMNEYSHLLGSPERASRFLDKSEIIKAAQFVVDVVKDEDEDQYNSLLMSIGVTPQSQPK